MVNPIRKRTLKVFGPQADTLAVHLAMHEMEADKTRKVQTKKPESDIEALRRISKDQFRLLSKS